MFVDKEVLGWLPSLVDNLIALNLRFNNVKIIQNAFSLHNQIIRRVVPERIYWVSNMKATYLVDGNLFAKSRDS